MHQQLFLILSRRFVMGVVGLFNVSPELVIEKILEKKEKFTQAKPHPLCVFKPAFEG
jgi:hypothetical protein